MVPFLQSKNKFLLFLFFFNLNLKLSTNNYSLTMQITDNELEIFHIEKVINTDSDCKEWIPSLFNPILLAIDFNYTQKTKRISFFDAIIPIFSLTQYFTINIYDSPFGEDYNATLGVIRFPGEVEIQDKNCYLGLLSRIGNYSIDNNSILINKLEKQGMYRKIFSFEKWDIRKDENKIKSYIHLGYEHNDFILEKDDGIIGECDVDNDYDYFGCSFTQMMINNKIMNISKSTGELYKLYFSSENNNIIFPEYLFNDFYEITDKKCSYNPQFKELEDYFVTCNNFFINDNYSNITLISENMNITIEIDNRNRFSTNNLDKRNKTRIRFEKDIDYLILPLIMFKNFHIQFNAENNKIKFYTTDSNILQINKKKKNNKKSSNAGKVFLIIFIIILILVLGFGVFWIIKKRKGSIEKNINKYNKFDEDENFQNMNEKRVF